MRLNSDKRTGDDRRKLELKAYKMLFQLKVIHRLCKRHIGSAVA